MNYLVVTEGNLYKAELLIDGKTRHCTVITQDMQSAIKIIKAKLARLRMSGAATDTQIISVIFSETTQNSNVSSLPDNTSGTIFLIERTYIQTKLGRTRIQ